MLLSEINVLLEVVMFTGTYYPDYSNYTTFLVINYSLQAVNRDREGELECTSNKLVLRPELQNVPELELIMRLLLYGLTVTLCCVHHPPDDDFNPF